MANKFYGSENSQANLITDLYGGYNDQAQRITKLYGPVEGRDLVALTGTIRQKTSGSPNITAFDPSIFLANVSTDTTKTVQSLQLTTASLGGIYVGDLRLWYTNSSYTILITDASAADLAPFGLTVDFTIYGSGFDFVDLAPTYSTVTMARLTHQGFGHNRYMTGATYEICETASPSSVKVPDLVASVDVNKFVERCNTYWFTAKRIQEGNSFSYIQVRRNTAGKYLVSYSMSPSGQGDIAWNVSYADAVAALALWGITLKSDPGDSNSYTDYIVFTGTYS